MSMQIVPIVREDSYNLGHAQISTRGITYLQENKSISFIPVYSDRGNLVALRAVREVDHGKK